MGLSICRQILDLHHGRISAQSAGVGQGSTFIISLPLYSDASPPPHLSASALTMARTPPPPPPSKLPIPSSSPPMSAIVSSSSCASSSSIVGASVLASAPTSSPPLLSSPPPSSSSSSCCSSSSSVSLGSGGVSSSSSSLSPSSSSFPSPHLSSSRLPPVHRLHSFPHPVPSLVQTRTFFSASSSPPVIIAAMPAFSSSASSSSCASSFSSSSSSLPQTATSSLSSSASSSCSSLSHSASPSDSALRPSSFLLRQIRLSSLLLHIRPLLWILLPPLCHFLLLIGQSVITFSSLFVSFFRLLLEVLNLVVLRFATAPFSPPPQSPFAFADCTVVVSVIIAPHAVSFVIGCLSVYSR